MQWIFTHFPRGLPTSSLFFFAISPLILKGLVPILQHLCRIFRNTPTFSLSDGFQRSYGHCFWDPTFFWSTLYLYCKDIAPCCEICTVARQNFIIFQTCLNLSWLSSDFHFGSPILLFGRKLHYCTVQHCTVLQSTVVYCRALCCTI